MNGSIDTIDPNDDELYLEAAEWLERLSEGPLDPLSKRRFTRWLKADERHEILLKRMQNSWQSSALDMALSSAQSQMSLTKSRRRPLWGYPSAFLGGLATACTLLLAVFVWLGSGSAEIGQNDVFNTAISELRDVQLHDGSSLTLNADTELSVSIEAERRRIVLRRGGAYFDVASDAARRFEVQVGGNSVVAVGTQFSVDRSTQGVDVIVYEGAVEVLGAGGRSPVLVKVGERVRISDGRVSGVESVDLNRIVDWRSGWIEIADEPLPYLLDQFERYSAKPIELESDRIADFRVAGRFRLRDTEANLALLSEAYSLQVSEKPEKIVVQLISE